MKLGLMVGYWMFGPQDPIALALEAERLGFDSVWTAEAYGSDAISPLVLDRRAHLTIKLGTGILQISARTPACVAMTAMTIDHLSGGRLILGVGRLRAAGGRGLVRAAVPEAAWPARASSSPCCGQMLKREGPVTFEGEHYQLPLQGGAGSRQAAQADHQAAARPTSRSTSAPRDRRTSRWRPSSATAGCRSTTRPTGPRCTPSRSEACRPGFEIACPVTVNVNDDLAHALLPVKYMLAFYIGGMGAKKQNFHANLVRRMGYGDAADKIQDLFFAGKRDEAAAAVPDEFADEISLVGPPARIRERLQVWKKSPVTTLLAGTTDVEALRVLAEANG